MATLTQQQREFIERYILRAPSRIEEVLTDQLQPESPSAAVRAEDTKFLMDEIVRLAPPAAASDTEIKDINDQRRELRRMVDADMSQADLRAASVGLEALVELHEQVASAIAGRVTQRTKLLKSASDIEEDIEEAFRKEDRAAIETKIEAIRTALPDPSSIENIAEATGLEPELAPLLKTAQDNLAADCAERRTAILGETQTLAESLKEEDFIESEGTKLSDAQEAVRSALPDPCGPGDIGRAEDKLKALGTLVTAIKAAILERATKRAERRAEMLKTVEDAMETLPQDVRSTDKKTAGDMAESIRKALPDPCSDSDLEAAALLAPQLPPLVKTAIENATTDREERATFRAEAIVYRDEIQDSLTTKDMSEEERKSLEDGIAALTTALPEPVLPAGFEAAQTAKKALETLVSDVDAAIEKRVLERAAKRLALLQEGQDLVDSVDAECAGDDTALVEAAQKNLSDALPDPSSEANLGTAGDLIAPLRTAVENAKKYLEQRQDLLKKAAAVVARLKWGEGKLAPHAKAPAGKSDPLKLEAEGIAGPLAALADWAQLKELPAAEIAAKTKIVEDADTATTTLEGKLETLNEEITQALADLALLVTSARDAVGESSVTALTDVQKQPFLDRITTAETAGEASLDDLSAVTTTLADIAKEARKLSAAIRPLRARLGKVGPAPGAALAAEATMLLKLRKAAEDALNGALEP
ncbi:hypothetical protein [uncultured Tateyamaria sp.]|uniref:hypothetical protein n=1 Tax=uncultured Tateyamaria sp. TaxID=455651 RepID=UPI0026208DFF|nr:hypothetical protein [uncultured Tateyamaria sp.]